MRVIGAGTCFENREYYLPWAELIKMVPVVVKKMMATIGNSEILENNFLLYAEDDKHKFTVAVKEKGEYREIIIDAVEKKIRLLAWNADSKLVDKFFDLLESYIEEYLEYQSTLNVERICPNCQEKVSLEAKYCFSCGTIQP